MIPLDETPTMEREEYWIVVASKVCTSGPIKICMAGIVGGSGSEKFKVLKMVCENGHRDACQQLAVL